MPFCRDLAVPNGHVAAWLISDVHRNGQLLTTAQGFQALWAKLSGGNPAAAEAAIAQAWRQCFIPVNDHVLPYPALIAMAQGHASDEQLAMSSTGSFLVRASGSAPSMWTIAVRGQGNTMLRVRLQLDADSMAWVVQAEGKSTVRGSLPEACEAVARDLLRKTGCSSTAPSPYLSSAFKSAACAALGVVDSMHPSVAAALRAYPAHLAQPAAPPVPTLTAAASIMEGMSRGSSTYPLSVSGTHSFGTASSQCSSPAPPVLEEPRGSTCSSLASACPTPPAVHSSVLERTKALKQWPSIQAKLAQAEAAAPFCRAVVDILGAQGDASGSLRLLDAQQRCHAYVRAACTLDCSASQAESCSSSVSQFMHWCTCAMQGYEQAVAAIPDSERGSSSMRELAQLVHALADLVCQVGMEVTNATRLVRSAEYMCKAMQLDCQVARYAMDDAGHVRDVVSMCRELNEMVQYFDGCDVLAKDTQRIIDDLVSRMSRK